MSSILDAVNDLARRLLSEEVQPWLLPALRHHVPEHALVRAKRRTMQILLNLDQVCGPAWRPRALLPSFKGGRDGFS